ncbi:hypothetical protein WJX79_000408 [Trebouxia sp. C0005]|nr:MAG: hypothetical protein FRX49_07038 [Trebouxia sp. A1-2]
MQLIDPTEITEKQLLQWYENIDLNKDGELDAGELQRALATCNLHFSLAVVAHMIRIQNHGRANSISCAEFCRLHGFLTDMQQSFQYFGQAHAGQLQQTEAMEALQHAGFQLDDMAFTTLFKAFNPDCTHWLSISEYIALTLFLQSASATFEAFDQQKKGVVTLNFNQWIYATANVV